MKKNLVYIQSGGPTSVINSSLYGAIIEARNHKKGLITALKVLGIILGVIGLFSLISGFTYMGMELTEYFLMGGALTTLDTLAYVMEGVAMIVSFLFTLIFSIFPFYLDDERKYN